MATVESNGFQRNLFVGNVAVGDKKEISETVFGTEKIQRAKRSDDFCIAQGRILILEGKNYKDYKFSIVHNFSISITQETVCRYKLVEN